MQVAKEGMSITAPVRLQPRDNHDPWLVRVRPNPSASLRMFCFPFAGAGASAYFPWQNLAHPSIELIAVQPPGRESRVRETPLSSLDAIASGATQAIRVYANGPYCLFGHSMGALAAFEVARKLRAEGYPPPVHLFVSARRAPHCPSELDPVHHLGDAELIEELRRRWGGIPDQVLREPELINMLLPGLRADLTAVEKYTHRQGERLDCPISVFGGEHDKTVAFEDLLAWHAHTRGTFRLRMIAGDHFFIRSHRQQIVDAVGEDLAPFLNAREYEAC
jgi:medium-chain acyl-[acyl-carrier-protein] hydrolase